MAHREESVLHVPQIPNEDEDAWPTYVLEDAKVWAKHNRRPQPLHHAHPDYPLVVSGILQPVADECQEYVKNEKGIGNRIRLNEVTKFASGTYGRSKKQQFVLWAFGKTGWFEIRPTTKYQAVYDDMIEGVKLFYFLCDQYTIRGKQRRPSAKQIFKAYVNCSGSRCANGEEAQQLLHKHYYFLISEMINDTQEIGWDKTAIFKNLVDIFPEATQNIRMRILESSEDGSQETDGDTSASEAQGTSESSEPPAAEPEPEPPLEMHTPKGPQRRKRTRPRQSVLRPTSSRPVKSAKSRGKAPALSDAESSPGSQAESEDENEGGGQEEPEEPENSEQDDRGIEGDFDEDDNGTILDEVDLPLDNAQNKNKDPMLNANRTLEPEVEGVLTTKRVKVVQSEGQRGARVENLLDFVLNRAGG